MVFASHFSLLEFKRRLSIVFSQQRQAYLLLPDAESGKQSARKDFKRPTLPTAQNEPADDIGESHRDRMTRPLPITTGSSAIDSSNCRRKRSFVTNKTTLFLYLKRKGYDLRKYVI